MSTVHSQVTERMAFARSQITGGSRQWRSAVTNGRLPAGIDMRSTHGRRYRDLVVEFTRGLTNGEAPSEADSLLVKQAAALFVRAEMIQSDIVNGAPGLSDEDVIRVTNAALRIFERLERHRGKAKGTSRSLMNLLKFVKDGA